MSKEPKFPDLWDYEINKIQSDINNPQSILQGKILTKLDFWIKNKKHIWRKTIANMPNPLDPTKGTVEESFHIYKYKNKFTLIPKTTFKIEGQKNG